MTFWQLSVYDLHWSNQEYNLAQQRLTQLLEQTLKQTPDPRASSRERNHWNEKKERIEQARANILKDSKEHFAVYAFTRKRLNNEHQHWFHISGWSLVIIRADYSPRLTRADPVALVDYIIQYCLFPRALLSPMDADFSAQFIKQMHLLGTPKFSTAHCYDRLIGDHIGNIVFSLTQGEARNYGRWPSAGIPYNRLNIFLGRFLRHILEDLTTWALNEATFKQENEDKRGVRLPGLRVKTGGEESFMTHSMLNNFFQKLHKKLWHVSLAICLPATANYIVDTCRVPHVERVYA